MSSAPATSTIRITEAGAMNGPIADHHVHLLSPADVDLNTPPVLPEIAVPEEVRSLLDRRAAAYADVDALARLHTSDALYYFPSNTGWVQGSDNVARHLVWYLGTRKYDIRPTRFVGDGNSARVAGYYTLPLEDGSTRYFGFFFYNLIRGRDGWRIGAESFHYEPVKFETVRSARDVIADMDRMGTRQAAIMSNAYYFDAVRLVGEQVTDPYPKVRAENDWTAAQVAPFAGRLVAFCSFNPLAEYAIEELDRCAKSRAFRGIKIHLNAAQVNFGDPAQVARLRAVFAAANASNLPIAVHVRPGETYGTAEAETFLHQVVAAAPDIPVQIAHLWGGETYAPEALAVYAEAVANGDPAARNLWFDVSGAWTYSEPADRLAIIAAMRRIGIGRMLFGSDAPPAEAWQEFTLQMPLTEAEVERIARNTAPYFN